MGVCSANHQQEQLELPFYWPLIGQTHFTVCSIRTSEWTASTEVGRRQALSHSWSQLTPPRAAVPLRDVSCRVLEQRAPRIMDSSGVQYALRTRWVNLKFRSPRTVPLVEIWCALPQSGRGRPAPAQSKNKVHLEVCSAIKSH